MKKRFPFIFLIVSSFFFMMIYLLLQPRVSGYFPFIRKYRLDTFIKNTSAHHAISAEEFWILREFYSPGFIRFKNRDVIYTSDKIASRESLVDKGITLDSLLSLDTNWTILFNTRNEMIATNRKAYIISFIKPIEEMSTANGFFDYRDKDKKLLESKNWYVTSEIQR